MKRAIDRRTILPYAIGFDLVLIAVGVSLLMPESVLTTVPFVGAVALATWRSGWKVGVATIAFSLLALLLTFGGSLPANQLLLFTLAGVAAAAVFDAGPREVEIPSTEGSSVAEESRRPAWRSGEVRKAAIYVGLPALVVILYLNLSYILIERFSVPSILQPLVLVLSGLILHYRHVFRPEGLILRSPTVALMAYCLVVFTSSTWARDVSVADGEMTDLVKSVMLMLVAGSLVASWRALRGALVALVAGAALVSLLSLAQVALGRPDLDFGGLADVEEAHLSGDLSGLRPGGQIGDPNYFARILLLAFPAAAFLGVGRSRRIEQVGYVAAAGVIALAVIFTYSRGGMLTLGFISVMLVVTGRVPITRRTLLAGVLLVAMILPTNVGERLLTIGNVFRDDAEALTDSSSQKRKQLLNVGWLMFNDHPIVGVGVGNFGANYAPYAYLAGFVGPDYTPLGVRQYAHNLYLETAVETGILGLLVFAAAMAIMLGKIVRARVTLLRRGHHAQAALITAVGLAIVGYLLASVFLHHSGVHRYLWIMLGLGIAAVRLTEDGLPDSAVPAT